MHGSGSTFSGCNPRMISTNHPTLIIVYDTNTCVLEYVYNKPIANIGLHNTPYIGLTSYSQCGRHQHWEQALLNHSVSICVYNGIISYLQSGPRRVILGPPSQNGEKMHMNSKDTDQQKCLAIQRIWPRKTTKTNLSSECVTLPE